MVTPQHPKTNSLYDNPDELIGNTSKKSRLKWWLLLILLLLLGTWASVYAGGGFQNVMNKFGIQGVPGPAGEAGLNGIDGKNGLDGVSTFSSATSGTSGTTGQNGADGATGATGADGAAGAAGTNGTNGTDGAPGSNDCISGICVSRQVSSPGVQEAGNINIDGDILATQIGINDTTPSNTLTVNGTADVQGHSAFGYGATVNGITSASDALSGATAHNTIAAVYETITTLDEASTMYEGLGGVLKLNPSAAPVFGQVVGNNGGVEIVSGNTQNFGGSIQGMNGSFIHAGTGTVSSATALQGPFLNTSTGNVTNGYGIRSIGINYNLSDTPCVTNVSCVISNYTGVDSTFAINLGTITNYKGIQIQTPQNAGTITNNWGLYIQDQSSVGSIVALNMYSAGLNSNNWLQGFVGIGNITGPLDGQVHIVNDGSGNSFKVSDANYADTSPFVIDSSGKVGVRTATPGTNNSVFEVTGSAYVSDYVYTSMLRSATETNSKIDLYDSSNGIAFIAQNNTKDFRWAINSGDDLMTLDGTTGHLGLGTTTPSYELELSQGDTWETELGITNTAAGKTLRFTTSGNATANWNIANANAVLFFSNAAALETSLELYDTTNVGIGTTFTGAPVKLTVRETSDTDVLRLKDTDGTCDHNPESGSETVSCSSDARLKTDIRDAASALSEINGLRIRDYTVLASGTQTTGLIAQEVLETNPEMVHMGEDGYYKVDSYNQWKVLKGIQELSLNVDTLGVDFASALEQTQGDIDGATELLATQGLQLDQLSQTLQDYATQLSELNSRVDSLEAEVRILKQQSTSSPANDSPPSE